MLSDVLRVLEQVCFNTDNIRHFSNLKLGIIISTDDGYLSMAWCMGICIEIHMRSCL